MLWRSGFFQGRGRAFSSGIAYRRRSVPPGATRQFTGYRRSTGQRVSGKKTLLEMRWRRLSWPQERAPGWDRIRTTCPKPCFDFLEGRWFCTRSNCSGVAESSPSWSLPDFNIKRLIVTEESLRGNKIKIPFVCQNFGIACINRVEMFRQESWKF